MFSAATKAQRPDLLQWLRDTILRQVPAGVASAQFAMAARAEQFAMLASAHMPVLCIRGAEDTLASAKDHARMARASGDGVNVTVTDAGHLVPIEQPVAFVEHASAFLAHIRTPHC
jgi:pimeloyl-ACP methyl ester carboxylesterase